MAPRVPARLSAREGRKFGLTVGIAFLALAAVMAWRGQDIPVWIAACLGAALILGGLAIPGSLGPVYHAWMGFAHAISRVTTPIVMAIIYYLVLTPIGLIMRVTGRNPVVHAPVEESYWQRRAPEGEGRGSMKQKF